MTTLSTVRTRCALCNRENEHTGIGSTNSFGSADLDTRPPPMMRDTMFAWVQRCSECGYCCSRLSEARPGAEEIVKEDEYRNQLSNQAYPKLANSFLCEAIIARKSNDYAGSTWALIHAAWACDDADKSEEAANCRRQAADMLITAESHGQQVAENGEASAAMLVDFLRRSGQADEARKVITENRSDIEEEVIARILDFQADLIEKGDVSCHTIAEVLD